MDKLRAIGHIKAALPTLPARERHTLIQFLSSSDMTFSHACDPRHRDAYRLVCRLMTSGESANPFCERCTALLSMMQDEDSFEEFRELVSVMLRDGLNPAVVCKLAATDSFRCMFRQLLHDGWLQPREEDATAREMMKLLHAQFAYQEGSGPKPLCVFDDQKFVATLEEDERVFQSLHLHEPDSNIADRIEDFFAKHPSGTGRQASDGGGSRARGATMDANREPQETRELKTSMSREALHQTAYTQITFANGTSAILPFEPSERGRALWSEWVDSHPFPAAPADMDQMLQSKWSVFVKSDVYQSLGPETALGQLFHGSRIVNMFGQAELRELYRHDIQRELYELACPWYSGGRDSIRAAQRIKDIGKDLFELGEDAIDFAEMGGMLSVFAHALSAEQFTNASRLYGSGHAAMMLHFIGLGLLTGAFDEVTNTIVPASRHSLPATNGGIVKMHHTKNLRSELEITGWQCVVEMLWHGIGQWEN